MHGETVENYTNQLEQNSFITIKNIQSISWYYNRVGLYLFYGLCR